MVALLHPDAASSSGRSQVAARSAGGSPHGGPGLRLVVDNTRHHAADAPARRPGDHLFNRAQFDGSQWAVIVVLGVLVFGGLFLVRSIQMAPTGEGTQVVANGGQVAAGGLVGGVQSSAEGEILVVRPGDSLWSIARSIAPNSDPRPVVAALAEVNGGDQIQIGQQIVIPGQLLD